MSDQGSASADAGDQLRKRYAGRPIRKMGHRGALSPGAAVPTGVSGLDNALEGNGLRAGEIVELYGEDSDTQAMLVCHLLAAAQRAGGICAYIDANGGFPAAHAERLGVDAGALLTSGGLCGEDLLAVAAKLAGGGIDVLVLDSVPGLTPRIELERQVGDGDPGLFGEMVSRGMRELALAMDSSSTLCVLLNRVGKRWHADDRGWITVRPAGRTLDRYVSRRLELRPLTRQSDRLKDPTRWRSRLRILDDGREPVLELDLDLEHSAGIRAAAPVADGPPQQSQ